MSQQIQETSANCQEGIIYIKGTPTHVLTFGGWLTDIDALETSKYIILVLPGNYKVMASICDYSIMSLSPVLLQAIQG